MRKQQGMTVIGMLMTMAVVVLAAIVVLRVVPVYIQYYSITQSIKALNTIPSSSYTGDSISDATMLRKSLTKRLDINGIEDLKPNELTIVPGNGRIFIVKLKYQAIRPLIYNVSLMFDFDDKLEVVSGSEH